MSICQRIQTELTDLFNNGQINNAVLPNTVFGVASRAIPSYYAGDSKADTVFVNLNPGDEVAKAEAFTNILLAKVRPQSVAAFVQSQIDKSTNAGYLIGNLLDHFDVKTAAFLSAWPNNGIQFPQKPLSTYTLGDTVIANTNCLNQKLQLELLPYPSSNFNNVRIDTTNAYVLFPFLETILDEIFQKERKYVIFASRKFETLFKLYNGNGKYHIQSGNKHFTQLVKANGGNTRNVSCLPIIITCKGSQPQKAMIACSFPNHAFSRAFDLMAQYGKFCYNKY